jgi:hypothetical protein
MRFSQRRTKSSIQFLAEDSESRSRLVRAVSKLAGSYEFKMVEESFFTAAEVYLGLNLPSQEREQQIKEIMNVINESS